MRELLALQAAGQLGSGSESGAIFDCGAEVSGGFVSYTLAVCLKNRQPPGALACRYQLGSPV